jgi:predicted GNAT superfamily acetyltransferase
MIIRNAMVNDFTEILGLNDDYVHFTSPMDRHKLQAMDSQCCYHCVVVIDGAIAAFLIAMEPTSDYQSDNFLWFKQRYDNFAYIDRVVVSKQHQGLGLGKALYENLFEDSRKQGFSMITCEYNIKPANIVSAKFHLKMGFSEVSQLSSNNGEKQLSMQMAML